MNSIVKTMLLAVCGAVVIGCLFWLTEPEQNEYALQHKLVNLPNIQSAQSKDFQQASIDQLRRTAEQLRTSAQYQRDLHEQRGSGD